MANKIPKNLKMAGLRVEKGLTQVQLAEELGLSAVHVNNIERKIRTPSLGVAMQIAKFLGVSVEELFGEGNDNIDQTWIENRKMNKAKKELATLLEGIIEGGEDIGKL